MKHKLNRGQKRFTNLLSNLTAQSPKNVLAVVGVGGGKSALPTIGLKMLREQHIAQKVCWVVPNLALAAQAEDSCTANWLQPFNGGLRVRRACNEIDPSRGADGFVTSYQAIASDSSGICAFEFARTPYLLVLDEIHHATPGHAWEKALRPLVALAHFRIYMTATLKRHDGKRIAFLPYRRISNGND